MPRTIFQYNDRGREDIFLDRIRAAHSSQYMHDEEILNLPIGSVVITPKVRMPPLLVLGNDRILVLPPIGADSHWHNRSWWIISEMHSQNYIDNDNVMIINMHMDVKKSLTHHHETIDGMRYKGSFYLVDGELFVTSATGNIYSLRNGVSCGMAYFHSKATNAYRADTNSVKHIVRVDASI